MIAAEEPAPRKGRGRISSIDELPSEADPDIQWAVNQLAARERTQADILFELNDRLAVIGCGPISSSAFHRYSMRRAAALRRLAETREVARAVSETLGPERGDDVTVMIVQMLKEAIHSILEQGSIGPKGIQELAKALAASVQAQRMSAEARRAAQAEIRRDLDKATEAAADGIASARPELDRTEVLKKIRSEIYGIWDKP